MPVGIFIRTKSALISGKKKCSACKKKLPTNNFYLSMVKGKMYPRSKCKKCFLKILKTPLGLKKLRAYDILHRKIRSGRLNPKPCLKCGNKKTVGHHSDYNKPLDVIWLCQSCHRRLHIGEFTVNNNLIKVKG